MVMIHQIGEVIKKVQATEDIEAKKLELRRNDSPPLREVIRLSYGLDPFTSLTETSFTYKSTKVPYPYNDAKLVSAARMFRVYRGPKNERITKRFVGLLESLHADEAEILLAAVQKSLDLGLNASQLLDALPGLFAEDELNPKTPVTRYFVSEDGALFRDDIDDMDMVKMPLREIELVDFEFILQKNASDLDDLESPDLPEIEVPKREEQSSCDQGSSESASAKEDKDTIGATNEEPQKPTETPTAPVEKKKRKQRNKKVDNASIFGA